MNTKAPFHRNAKAHHETQKPLPRNAKAPSKKRKSSPRNAKAPSKKRKSSHLQQELHASLTTAPDRPAGLGRLRRSPRARPCAPRRPAGPPWRCGRGRRTRRSRLRRRAPVPKPPTRPTKNKPVESGTTNPSTNPCMNKQP